MAFQYSDAARNAANDAIETAIGASPTLEIRTGGVPANCAAAATGTVLASLALPADFLTNSSGGVKSILGTWQANATAAGVAGHFRIRQGATCHIQGTASGAGGGGDMILDNANIASGQSVTVTAFSNTMGGG